MGLGIRNELRPGVSHGGVTLAHNVAEREQVDVLLERAAAAGGTIVSLATDQPWGHTGYFADPDGHPWEIAWPAPPAGVVPCVLRSLLYRRGTETSSQASGWNQRRRRR